MIPIHRSEHAEEFLEALRGSPCRPGSEVSSVVEEIILSIRSHGDEAVGEYCDKFGDCEAGFVLSDEQVQQAIGRVPESTRELIQRAAKNIRAFAVSVMGSLGSPQVAHDGITAGADLRAVRSAGCYVPGGRYPLPSSALMTTIPAHVAGVADIALTSPRITDEVIFAGSLAGVSRFYSMGGAHAVAALALGTPTIDNVDIIVGPGNSYVTEAKRQLRGTVEIDLLAGPSEIAVIADGTADPDLIALDILAQTEHDPDARAWLLTNSEQVATSVVEATAKHFASLSLPDFAADAVGSSAILVLESIESCASAANRIAPEHLLVATEDPEAVRPMLVSYGALFLGQATTVAFGDYMAGPNHTLPTAGSARFSGSLSPLTFLRLQSWIKADGNSASMATDTAAMADLEGLSAHAAAARARMLK